MGSRSSSRAGRPLPRGASAPESQRGIERPLWATGLAAFCAVTVVFLVVRDLTVPHVRNTEVWFGIEVHGWLAIATAPIHWLVFAAGAWGYWFLRPWVWPWASVYASTIAVGHLIWNLSSPAGGGWSAGLVQLALFSVPPVLLLWARPDRERADSDNLERGKRIR